VKRASVAAFASIALAACGTQDWTFGTDATPGADARALADGSRGGCSSDSECMLQSLHCDPGSGQCVACLTDSQCPSLALPRCDSMIGRCVQCGNDGDCGPGQACESTTHTCVASCASSAECPPGESCSPSGVCVGCTDDQDCAGGRTPAVCDPTIGQCVECTSDLQCPADQTCDRTSDRCVGCLSSFDCTRDQVCDMSTLECVGSADAGRYIADGGDELGYH
jgi:hypothetical protein